MKFNIEFISWVETIDLPYHEKPTSEGFLSVIFSDYQLAVVLVEFEILKRIISIEGFQQGIQKELIDMRVVFLWEDIWKSHQQIVKSRIQAFLGLATKIHGRQTTVIEVDNKSAKMFLDQHHMLGYTKAKYCYGLNFGKELVAVASFGREVTVERDFGPSQSHEIIRFCYRKNIHVRGGLSKIIKHFIQKHKPGDIYTSVDIEWSDGSGYSTIGFEEIGRTAPIPFWIDSNGLRHRMEIADSMRIANAGNIKMMLVA